MDRTTFDAYISLPSNNTSSLCETIEIISKFSKVELICNKQELYYKSEITEKLLDGITEEEVQKLKDGNWITNGNLLIKNM